MKRRYFLATTASVLAATTLAGCSDDSGSRDVRGTPRPDVVAEGEPGTARPTAAGQSSAAKVEVRSHEFYMGEWSFGVKGVIENVSNQTLNYAEVTARFYDNEGTLLADGMDNWLDLEPGRAEFDTIGFGVDDPERIEEYKISVDWNIH